MFDTQIIYHTAVGDLNKKRNLYKQTEISILEQKDNFRSLNE